MCQVQQTNEEVAKLIQLSLEFPNSGDKDTFYLPDIRKMPLHMGDLFQASEGNKRVPEMTFYFYWDIDLQCCVSFRCTAK